LQAKFSRSYITIILVLIVVLVSWIVIRFWFSPLNFNVIMGDDLHFAKKFFAYSSSPDGYFLSIMKSSASADRFRPITYSILGTAFTICKKDYSCFFDNNQSVFFINFFLVLINSFLITNKKLELMFFPPFIFLFSRFSYYSVLQIMGLMENFAMMFLLLISIFTILFINNKKGFYIDIVILFFAIIISTHERFMVLLIPILFLLISNRKDMSNKSFLLRIFFLFIIISFYFYFRLIHFKANFLTGTGGTYVTETFDILQMLGFIINGLLNMVGFNAGPDYLSGKFFLDAGILGIILGISVSFSLILLFFIYFSRNYISKDLINWNYLIFSFLVFGGLIFSSSITIRQEYRWLYTPFIIFILLIFHLLSQIIAKRTKVILAIFIFLSFLSVDLFYRNYVENIFFIKGLETSILAKDIIIDGQELAKKPDQDIYLVTDKLHIKNWYFANDYFFKFYSGNNSINIKYFNFIDEITSDDMNNLNPLIFQIDEKEVTQIPHDYIDLYLLDKNLENQTTSYDFVNNFSTAKLSSNEQVDSPTGKIAFLWDWLDENKIIKKSITLVSPYSVEFSDISCNQNAVIKLSSGIPFSAGDGAELLINVKNDQNMQKSLEILLPPAENDQIISWNNSDMIIDEFCGRPFDVFFEAKSNSGDTSYDWVVINSAKIIEIDNDNN